MPCVAFGPAVQVSHESSQVRSDVLGLPPVLMRRPPPLRNTGVLSRTREENRPQGRRVPSWRQCQPEDAPHRAAFRQMGKGASVSVGFSPAKEQWCTGALP